MRKALFSAIFLVALTLVGCVGGWGGRSSTGYSYYEAEPVNPSRSAPPPPPPPPPPQQQGGRVRTVSTPPPRSAPGAVTSYGGSNLFRLPMADGQPVTVKSPAVLFFYTSWCGYCKQAFPEFKSVTARARNQGWRVYGIQVGEGPDKVNQVISQFQPNFPVLMDQQSLVSRQYRIEGYPTFIIIDESGRISYNSHDLPRDF